MNLNYLREKLGGHHPISFPETTASAAVLILLMHNEKEEVFLVVTKRSQQVSRYAGDYCFPGGLKELDDVEFIETLHREVEEELGMCPQSYHIIGQLDDFYDRYHHLVRPFVATIAKENFEARLGVEIEKLDFFPLTNLQNFHEDKDLERITKRHPAYKYVEGEVVIWGLTASIMVHLYNILYDEHRAVGKGTSTK